MDKINLKAVLLQNMGEDSADFLPIMGDEKELLNDNMQIPDTLPILPLRNTVLFPGVIIPINIGRDKSLKLIKDSYRQSALIGVVAQKDTNTLPDRNSSFYPENTGNAGRNHHSHHSRQEKVFIGRYPLRRSLPCWEDQFEKRRRGT